MGNYRKQTKHFKIGDYDFTLGINREMAVRFFKVQPKILEHMNNLSELEKKLEKDNSDNKLEGAAYIDFINSYCQIEQSTKKIVDYALPEMLEYGGMNEKSSKEYAKSLIKFCEENEILYNEEGEDENGAPVIIKGVYTYILEFIQLGFSGGKGMPNNKMPKVKIIVD